ncbi:MAG: hypothetical protein J6S72_06490 [Lachnospiraceae bacterium]|nr:hypothetical protein [Lachnospiraceae bacterium]
MRFFFIDLENVRSEGLEGVSSLSDSDMVFIYYSENAMNLSIPTLENLNNSRASKKFIKTNYIGKNAMDFQIVSLFGAMIERNRQGSYYIISQDNGFRSAVSFCESYFEDYGITCGVYPTIISAITAEMKNSLKNAPAKKKPAKQAAAPQAPAAKQAQPAPAPEEAGEPDKAQEEPAAKKKSRRRRRKSSQSKQENTAADAVNGEIIEEEDPASADQAPEKEPAVKETAPEAQEETQTADKLGYIYTILGSLLSQKTISLYAEAIDEAVAGCKNREELHTYFRDHFGEDEGEALFKVTQGDFERMKQERPKKSSGRRRRPRRRS